MLDTCFEILSYRYHKKMLKGFAEIVRENIPVLNKNNNKEHIYYLIVKFYIYHIGIECNKKYPLMPNIEYLNFEWLIKDIKNTINYDLKPHLIIPKFKNLANDVLARLKNPHQCSYEIKYGNDTLTCISDKTYTIPIDQILYNKLQKIYTGPPELFNEYVFIGLQRYQLFGTKKENISLSANFIYNNQKVRDKINLDIEMFGSFVNCNLDKYCSIFHDIEKYFGSIGSVFCLDPSVWIENKYFIANPPFDELIMSMMSFLIVDILDKYDNCCFVVIIPDWRPSGKYQNNPYEAYDTLNVSKYKKFEIIYNNIKYHDYFQNKDIHIGKTKTIVIVLSNFDISLTKSDFL